MIIAGILKTVEIGKLFGLAFYLVPVEYPFSV